MSTFYEREIPIASKAILHTPGFYKSSANQNQRSHVGETRVLVPVFTGHTANTNRVISFHSASCWRKYFHASKYSDKLIVIYFTASWCAPCRYMGPILDEFASQYTDVEFDKIDVDELFCVSQEFGVQTMPTFMFVRRGIEIDRVTGARRDELQRKIEKHRE